jgi:hypothetical protein
MYRSFSTSAHASRVPHLLRRWHHPHRNKGYRRGMKLPPVFNFGDMLVIYFSFLVLLLIFSFFFLVVFIIFLFLVGLILPLLAPPPRGRGAETFKHIIIMLHGG